MISLADLRARNVTPVWQEAVAVIQELIQTVKATTGSAELLPDLEHIALIPNGDVVSMPGSPEPLSPVRHAAVMLKLLTEGTPAPPELEAFITRNVSDPPQYDSVNEFSRNLAFFERPGRRADVERLVGRAMAAEQTRRADDELRRLKERASEVENKEPAPEFLQQPKKLRTVPVPLIALLLVAALVLPAWWWLRSQPAPPAAEAVAPAAETPAAADATAAAESQAATETPGAQPAEPGAQTAVNTSAAPGTNGVPASANSDRGLLDRTTDAVKTAMSSLLGRDETPRAATVQPAPAPAPAPTQPAPRRRSRRAAPARATAVNTAPAPLAPAAAPIVTTSRPVLAPATIERATEMPDAVAVFTRMDASVIPPVLVRPVLPKEPPPNVPPEKIGTIEVVVDEQGDVVNVKLISPANRYHERMLVSAAKMWKFRPAYKDGQPVRYRTRVRLTI